MHKNKQEQEPTLYAHKNYPFYYAWRPQQHYKNNGWCRVCEVTVDGAVHAATTAYNQKSEKRPLITTTLQVRHLQLHKRLPARGRRRSAPPGHSKQVRRVQAGVGIGMEVKVAQVRSAHGGGW